MNSLRTFSPKSVLMAIRKVPKKIDYRQISRTAKSPLFSTIAFAAIFFIIYADSLLSSFSAVPSNLKNEETYETFQTFRKEGEQSSESWQIPNNQGQQTFGGQQVFDPQQIFGSSSSNIPVLPKQSGIQENEVAGSGQQAFIPQQTYGSSSSDIPGLTTQVKTEENGVVGSGQQGSSFPQQNFGSTSNNMPGFTMQEKTEENGVVGSRQQVFDPQPNFGSTSGNMPVLTVQENTAENGGLGSGQEVLNPQQNFGSSSNNVPVLTTPIQVKTEENGVAGLTSSNMPVLTTQVKTEANGVDSEVSDPLIPPSNATREERIAWFQTKLPEVQIIQSTSVSQQFHGRLLQFYNSGCAIQFFMIWLSPAEMFGPREFVAVDSLFKANPTSCLMILSPSMDSRRGYEILKPVLDRGFKVLAITPDLPFLVKDTPAESWLDDLKNGKVDPGSIPLSINLTNLIRLAMLYRYGGIYLDTDFIILKSFTGLRNTIGAQSIDQVTKKWSRLNGAVMIFDIGHPILIDFLQEFATTFNGNKWGFNGPYLISRVVERVGNTPGYDLTILSPRSFYPIDWIKIEKLFKKPEEADSGWVANAAYELTSNSYALHLWNKRTRDLIIEPGSVMEKLISDSCVVCKGDYNSYLLHK